MPIVPTSPRGQRRKRQPRRSAANWGRCAARPEKLHVRALVRCVDCRQHNPNL